jgi:hypothetical protein
VTFDIPEDVDDTDLRGVYIWREFLFHTIESADDKQQEENWE